jgi:hypothetical protein
LGAIFMPSEPTVTVVLDPMDQPTLDL